MTLALADRLFSKCQSDIYTVGLEKLCGHLRHFGSPVRHQEKLYAERLFADAVVSMFVSLYMKCVNLFRTPVLATSVREQLETGAKSTNEVPDQATQVNDSTCI